MLRRLRGRDGVHNMTANGLKSPRPAGAVRVLLLVEVFGYVAVAIAFIWLALPARGAVRWYHVAFFIFAGCFPICMNLLHGDRPRDSGLCVDNLRGSIGEVALATAAMGCLVAGVGLAAGGFHWVSWKRFGDMMLGYPAWGIAQQYVIQAFILRRLRQAGLVGPLAVVATAVLFGLAHAPNWALAGSVAGAAVVWCTLFLRRANLITLGVSHGVLAVLLYHAWPEEWLHRLTIGWTFVKHSANAAG